MSSFGLELLRQHRVARLHEERRDAAAEVVSPPAVPALPPLNIPRSSLVPLAEPLLSAPETLLSWSGTNGTAEVIWPQWKHDARVLATVCEEIKRVEGMGDARFRLEMLPHLRQRLLTTELYHRLNDPGIVVTNGHRGTTPFEHSFRVTEWVSTDHLAHQGMPWARSLPRVAGLTHDMGKVVSAGYPPEKLQVLLREFGHTKHSHPNHIQFSQAILERLLQDEQLRSVFPPDFWHYLQQVIKYHHFFEVLMVAPEHEQVEAFKRQATREYERLFPYLFSLTFADVASNPNYACYLQANFRTFQHLLHEWWDEFEPQVQQYCAATVWALREVAVETVG